VTRGPEVSRYCTSMTAVAVSRRALRAATLVACAALAASCDPPPAKDMLLGPTATAPFAVDRPVSGRVVVPADGDIVVRFTDDVDPRSVGARSVRVTRSGGRAVAVATRIDGRELRVAPPSGREFPAGEKLRIRIEGSPSPRAVRSAAGETLSRAFETTFRVGARRRDLVGPRLVATRPADGADHVAPNALLELRFSEPLAAGAVKTGDAVSLRVDGVATSARLTLSRDRAMIVVHPTSPLPPDRVVEVDLHDCLLDAAGNPLDAASPRAVSFRTRATPVVETTEDFIDAEKCDVRRTSCGWDDSESPGTLVGRAGVVLVGPDADGARRGLGDATSLRFQILVPRSGTTVGLASALRVEFDAAPEGARLLSAVVEAGATPLDAVDPSFVANRAAAQPVVVVARTADALDIEDDDAAAPFVDVPFDAPLRLDGERSVLLDVRLEVDPGVRVAAWRDAGPIALVEGRTGLAPAASLVVAPASPQARSLWYDTGVASPGWRPASVLSLDADSGVDAVVEFQSAPAAADGGADAGRASAWDVDLERLPAYRFVRFRVRFEGTPDSGTAPRIDRIVLPYER